MNAALLRLLQLVSPTLPVGAYTYSQGLEWAVETGEVRNEATTLAWIGGCLESGVARFEAVYLAHMLAAWSDDDIDRLAELDAEFVASRESAELRAETLQMGHSLARLLADLINPRPQAGEGGAQRRERENPAGDPNPQDRPLPNPSPACGGGAQGAALNGFETPNFPLPQPPTDLDYPRPQAGEGGAQRRERGSSAGNPNPQDRPLPNPSPACGGGARGATLDGFETPSFPLAWSCAAAHWRIAADEAVAGYLWAWAENQVMAAVKAVPLGQTAGQRMLLELGRRIPALAGAAAAAPLEASHNYLPAFAIACSRHETQYTRLFRS
jgi:urease accessory protein UreF